jgi:hypothetical protein
MNSDMLYAADFSSKFIANHALVCSTIRLKFLFFFVISFTSLHSNYSDIIKTNCKFNEAMIRNNNVKEYNLP